MKLKRKAPRKHPLHESGGWTEWKRFFAWFPERINDDDGSYTIAWLEYMEDRIYYSSAREGTIIDRQVRLIDPEAQNV